jgi:hypothetical protein
MRHQDGVSIENVAKCFYCGTAQDSLVHLFTECTVVSSSRALFFSSLSLPQGWPKPRFEAKNKVG